MTFDEMCAFVRTHADADTIDAPTSSLMVYARMAYNDILARRSGWPHLEVAYTLTTAANQPEYAFTTFSSADLDVLTGVIDNTNIGRRLVAITRSDADLLYSNTSVVGASNAVHYTLRGSNVVLFPTPTSIRTYLVRGYRTAVAWPTTAGSIPDLPRVFDEVICWFMLSQYYLSQEDAALASMYMNEYQQQADRWVRSENMKTQTFKPNIMGGANVGGNSFLRRVRGMLE